ncbi:MAG: NTP/NDP exchange transporter [Alphaproteobacteria bacterium]
MGRTGDTLSLYLRRALDLRAGEGRGLVLAFLYFFFLLGGYTMLRPLRDEMGVASGVDNLQYLFTATFVVMLAAVPAFGALVSRRARARIVPNVYRFFIASILLFYLLFSVTEASVWTARAFYVWVSVLNLFVVSVFWSLMNDLFVPGQAKRLFPVIAAGGTAGALAGPLAAANLAGPLGPTSLLLLAAGAFEIAVWCVYGLLRARPAREIDRGKAAVGGGIFDGFTLVLRSPYLIGVALFFLLMTSAATFLYFIQAHFVRDLFPTPAERIAAFAWLDFFANSLTVLLQLFVAGRLLRYFGVGFGLAVLPIVVAGAFAALALMPVFAMLAAIQVLRRAAQYAVSRPAREALFTPLSPSEKYKAKNVIDTAVYRGGDAGSGWVFAGLRGAGLDFAAIALIMVPVAGLWAGLAFSLGRRREALAEDTKAMEAIG